MIISPKSDKQKLHYACEDLNDVQAGSIRGKIWMIKRGKCDFVSKARRAMKYGATGLLIVNSDDNIFHMSIGSEIDNISIPVFLVARTVGVSMLKKMGCFGVAFCEPQYAILQGHGRYEKNAETLLIRGLPLLSYLFVKLCRTIDSKPASHRQG